MTDVVKSFLALFRERRRAWSASRAPVVATNALVVGQPAKVEGIARVLEQVVAAPFTQRPALAWRTFLVEKPIVDAPTGAVTLPGSMPWVPRIQETFSVAFVVEDESGRVAVDPTNARFVMPMFDVGDHPKVNDDNAALRAYLHPRGVQSSMFMGAAGKHDFREALISPGDRVRVWGVVRETTGVTATGYRDSATRTLSIAGTPDEPCVVVRAQ